MKINIRLFLGIFFTSFLLVFAALPVLAASSDFLPQATEFYNRYCTRRRVSTVFAISCYLFDKVHEIQEEIAQIQQNDATQSAKLVELEERILALEGVCESVTLLDEDFVGPDLNTAIWEFFNTNGGTYNFDGDSIVATGGTSMFYIRSKENPFPSGCPFTVEFGIQYTTVDESGIGIALGFEQQNGYDPFNVPVAYWQGNNFGLQVVRFGLTEAVIGSNPDLSYHVGKIMYDGDKYQVFLDGALKYTSPPSATAKSLWFGNPFCCRSNWTGFKLDYIKVTQP